MGQCKNLGLVRFSANNLKTIPPWIKDLERLAWFAIAGNPCSPAPHDLSTLPLVTWNDVTILETLGQGASGTTYKALWNKEGTAPIPVAIKVFKNEVTSDGYPLDEIRSHQLVSGHPNITAIMGELVNVPERKKAVILELIPSTYTVIGKIPSFESCTRDCYDQNTKFSCDTVMSVALQVAAAAAHLHRHKLMHGDLYAHNILHDATKYRALLGDFGATTYYGKMMYQETGMYEKTDALAYGYLLEELLERCDEQHPTIANLMKLKIQCQGPLPQRPLFEEVVTTLRRLDTI